MLGPDTGLQSPILETNHRLCCPQSQSNILYEAMITINTGQTKFLGIEEPLTSVDECQGQVASGGEKRDGWNERLLQYFGQYRREQHEVLLDKP